tara:strand:+ start:676 stop:1482 length:807 start_codon:yes stop_codon:yes gene_type:complete
MNQRQKKAKNWFTELRDKFCSEFESIDGNKFKRKKWSHKGKGGGEMSIMKGDVFEKVGVNISTVSGNFSKEFRSQIKGTQKSSKYWASGISLVAHMHSPKVPAFHFNTRYLVTGDSWFGGGADMTPCISNIRNKNLFHKKMKEACDSSDKTYYPEFKKNCDEYFYLPHRKEARGIGGIFFDHLNTGDWENDFKFIQDVGLKTFEVISQIVVQNKDFKWTQKQKEIQLLKRGRYVEFNLIWDRGTLFGLRTGGSTEAILMSMPPTAKWN